MRSMSALLRAKGWQWRDFFYLRKSLAPRSPFWSLYKELEILYHKSNPFTLNSQFWKKEEVPYGETPYATLDHIAKLGNIHHSDLILDVGSGRGVALFYLHYLTGCSGVGLEANPFFIDQAKLLSGKYDTPINWMLRHIESPMPELAKFTVVYYYATAAKPSTLEAFEKNLKYLKKGSLVILVTQELSKDTAKSFTLESTEQMKFPWGKTQVNFYRKVSA